MARFNPPVRLIFWVPMLLVMVALAGVLLGSPPVNARGTQSSVIYACGRDGVGIVKIVDADETCPENWTLLEWNIQGPPGLPGSQGVQGAQGLQGQQGPQGPPGTAQQSSVDEALLQTLEEDMRRLERVLFGLGYDDNLPSSTSLLGQLFAKTGSNMEDIQTLEGDLLTLEKILFGLPGELPAEIPSDTNVLPLLFAKTQSNMADIQTLTAKTISNMEDIQTVEGDLTSLEDVLFGFGGGELPGDSNVLGLLTAKTISNMEDIQMLLDELDEEGHGGDGGDEEEEEGGSSDPGLQAALDELAVFVGQLQLDLGELRSDHNDDILDLQVRVAAICSHVQQIGPLDCS